MQGYRAVGAVSRRFFATKKPAATVNWKDVRAKMVSEESRALVEKAEAAFHAREAAVTATGVGQEIDWARYEEALPHLDVAAIRKDFETYVSNIPAIVYDESADKAEHKYEEESFDALAAYAKNRVGELRELQAESADHALTDEYTVARAFQRFDGLYEKEWAEYENLNFESSTRTFQEIPDDLSSEKKKELASQVAKKLGTTPSKLGFRE